MSINLLAKSFTTAGGTIKNIDPPCKLPTVDGRMFELVDFALGTTSFAIRYTIDGQSPAEDRRLMLRKGPDMHALRLWSGPDIAPSPLDHEAVELLYDFCLTLAQQEHDFHTLRRLQAKVARGEMPDIAIEAAGENASQGPN